MRLQWDRAFRRTDRRACLPVALPRLTTLELRWQDMDAMGIDVQVISPSPMQYYYWAEEELARTIVHTQNEQIAAICAAHPTRFAGLGNVALQHPELAVEQLDYAVNKLGLRGVEISTTVGQLDLDDPRFEQFWSKAEELSRRKSCEAVVYLSRMVAMKRRISSQCVAINSVLR